MMRRMRRAEEETERTECSPERRASERESKSSRYVVVIVEQGEKRGEFVRVESVPNDRVVP